MNAPAAPDFVPLDPARHAGMGWSPPRGYARFRGEILAPALLAEIPALIAVHPLAFAQVSGGEWEVMALMGLHPGRNLFLDADGRWRGGYVPSALRGHPFAAARGPEGAGRSLAFDMASGLLRERPDPQAGDFRFFDDQGEPSEKLTQVIGFLSRAAADRARTRAAAAALAEAGLLVPWTPQVANPDPETPFQAGLRRVDGERLAALDAESLARLHRAQALLPAHAQMLSAARTGLLAGLAREGAQARALEAAAAANRPLFSDDDMFDFGPGA